jgi:DNA-binding MarR family transcriptional regulator
VLLLWSAPVPRQNLGSLLNQLLDRLDREVQQVYEADGLAYRPRYTPVMRTLGEVGPAPITAIARRAKLTHSAASQTVAQMARAGLVSTGPGEDARQRIVRLTPKGEAMLPRLRGHWAATAAALESLSADVGQPIEAMLEATLAALDRRSLRERIAEAHAAPGAEPLAELERHGAAGADAATPAEARP